MAGGTIRSLSFPCFPALLDNLQAVDISDFQEDFHAAFQSLESFRLTSPAYEGMGEYEDLAPDTVGDLADRYVAAVISAPSLRDLHVNFQSYGFTSASCPSGSVLSAVTSEDLDALTLCDVTPRERDLDHLCKSLGDSPKLVQLCRVGLSEGSWAPGIDMLRRKTEARCAEGACSVGVDKLRSGEFTGIDLGFSMQDWVSASGPWPVGPPLAIGKPYH